MIFQQLQLQRQLQQARSPTPLQHAQPLQRPAEQLQVRRVCESRNHGKLLMKHSDILLIAQAHTLQQQPLPMPHPVEQLEVRRV